VTLRDFFYTHGLEKEEIWLEWWDQPGAGGYGFYDPIAVWQQFYAIVQYVEPVLDVGGAAVGGATFIWQRLRRNASATAPEVISPGAFFSLLVSRNQWNVHELSDLVDITADEARALLKGCGFDWDSHRGAYFQTERTKEVVAKLENVKWFQDHPPSSQ
jgi:hypothetical protein